MRRPHVFERTAPRVGREVYQGPANRAVVARTIAAQLGTMLDKADAAGLVDLSGFLDAARVAAEDEVERTQAPRL